MEGSDMYKKVAGIGGKSTDEKTTQRKALIGGACVGALFGIYYAYSRKKNYLGMAIGGAIVGAIVTKVFMPR